MLPQVDARLINLHFFAIILNNVKNVDLFPIITGLYVSRMLSRMLYYRAYKLFPKLNSA